MTESTATPAESVEEASASNAQGLQRTTLASLPGLYADLVKFRLSLLVVGTAAVGACMASYGDIPWPLVGWTVLGTMLCAGFGKCVQPGD